MENKEKEIPQEENSGGKVEKEYQEVLATFNALLGGTENVPKSRKSKIPNDGVSIVVNRMLEKRQKDAQEKFEKEAEAMIEEMLSYNDDVKKAKDTFEKTVEERRKEFIKKAKTLFSGVENIAALKQRFVEGLRAATATATGAPETEAPK